MRKKENIPVVIFCGGYGSRIKEETIYKPKTMLNVGKFPLLWHIMKIYKYHGFNNFVLTLGYKGDYIKRFMKSRKGKIFSDFKISLIDTGQDTPTGGRLLRAESFIKSDTFMCTYGDGVSNIDLNDLYKHHSKYKNVAGTITGVTVPHKFGIISLSKSGYLKSYKKGHPMSEPINAGFMVLNKKYLEYLKDDMMIEDPFNVLAQEKRLSVYHHKGYFGAVDTYKDLETLNELWGANAPWKIWKK